MEINNPLGSSQWLETVKVQKGSLGPVNRQISTRICRFFPINIQNYFCDEKSWQYPVDKAKMYDILWQTNESERVRLFALF